MSRTDRPDSPRRSSSLVFVVRANSRAAARRAALASIPPGTTRFRLLYTCKATGATSAAWAVFAR